MVRIAAIGGNIGRCARRRGAVYSGSLRPGNCPRHGERRAGQPPGGAGGPASPRLPAQPLRHRVPPLRQGRQDRHGPRLRASPGRAWQENSRLGPAPRPGLEHFESFTLVWEHRQHAANNVERHNLGCHSHDTEGAARPIWVRRACSRSTTPPAAFPPLPIEYLFSPQAFSCSAPAVAGSHLLFLGQETSQ